MERQKVVISLDAKERQSVERIVADRDSALALEFVKEIIKPRIDAVINKGHCKPIFEWRQGSLETIKPPPIENGEHP